MKRINYFLSVLFFTTFALTITSCKEEAIPQLPIVITFPVSDIEQQTATCGGSVTTEMNVSARGVCWSTHQNPTILDSISIDGTEKGSFSSYLLNLKPDSTYYVRAYATNSVGTGYGSEMKFKTKHAQINVITLPITDISLSSAMGAGIITSDNGINVNERGICWSESMLPTINDSKLTVGEGEGSFNGLLTGLSANKVYYVRAFASSSNETIYGSLITFKTRQIALNVTTLTINEITTTTATCGGIVSCDLSSSVTARGICWSTNDNPSVADNKTTDGVGVGSFTSNIQNLAGNTTYYLRAYATNMEGTAYGSTMSFKTNPVAPSISTLAVNNITANSAKCDVKILNNGGSPITTYGICYSESPNPSLLLSATFTTGSAVIDNFTHTLDALKSNTHYYVRSYATNAIGTTYGNELEFTTSEAATTEILFNDKLTYGSVSDVDGNTYKTITIGTQTWMAENLRSTKFRNGDAIPTTATVGQDISSEASPIYQWSLGNTNVNGRLYTWFAATDARNVCPVGWHLPTDAEWTTLIGYLGGENIAGDKLREKGTVHWGTSYITNNGLATNESGFTALPAGSKETNGVYFPSNICVFWGSTSNKPDSGVCRQLWGNYSYVQRTNNNKKDGYSIRCIKD